MYDGRQRSKNVRLQPSSFSLFDQGYCRYSPLCKTHHAMPVEYRVGQRVSFKGHRCTVRYIGAVEGTDQNKIWLGVEWDDPARGKHNGEYLGRSYFKCMFFK
jgi:hypothetical protein